MIKMVSTIWSTTEYNHFFHISDCSGSYWTRLLPPGNMEQTGLLHCGLWVILFIHSTQYWNNVFNRALEYLMDVEKLNLSAIRTVRVLRPLKAINRIPSMRLENGFIVSADICCPLSAGSWWCCCWTPCPCWAMCCCSASLSSSSLGLWGCSCGQDSSDKDVMSGEVNDHCWFCLFDPEH